MLFYSNPPALATLVPPSSCRCIRSLHRHVAAPFTCQMFVPWRRAAIMPSPVCTEPGNSVDLSYRLSYLHQYHTHTWHDGKVHKSLCSVLLIKRYNLYKILACSTGFLPTVSILCHFLPIVYIHIPCVFQNVVFQTWFRSSNWPFRHGFPSLNLLNIIILGHAFYMA